MDIYRYVFLRKQIEILKTCSGTIECFIAASKVLEMISYEDLEIQVLYMQRLNKACASDNKYIKPSLETSLALLSNPQIVGDVAEKFLNTYFKVFETDYSSHS